MPDLPIILAITGALLELLTVPSSRRAEQPYQWAYCRRAPGGCEARVRAMSEAFVASGLRFDLDPYLLAAIAWHESRLDPEATGSSGECGVMQLHPRRKDTRAIGFCSSSRDRAECLRRPDACQAEVIATGAAILRRSIDDCDGDVLGGLWRYHTGQRRCIASRYGRRVMDTVLKLKGSDNE